jgi:hypothetical protein
MRPKVLETPKEWGRCLEAGAAAIRRPYELRQFARHGLPKLTVYHIPSFQDSIAWTIYRARGDVEYTLQTVIWRQVADGKRMEELMHGRIATASAEPTLLERISLVPTYMIDQQFAALAAIRIPLLANSSIGCDGEFFGISVRREFELEWWCDGPPEWGDLVKWTHECIQIFREATLV